jgi:hypothetical protein
LDKLSKMEYPKTRWKQQDEDKITRVGDTCAYNNNNISNSLIQGNIYIVQYIYKVYGHEWV